MSWVTIEVPPLKNPSSSKVPVTVGIVNRLGHSISPRLLITVRAALLGDALAWWKAGDGIAAQMGTGEHHGRVRLSKGGPHRLTGSGGCAKARPAPVARLPLPAGVAPTARKGYRAAFEIVNGDLIVTLPDWAISPALLPAKAGNGFRTAATAISPALLPAMAGTGFRTAATAPDFAKARG